MNYRLDNAVPYHEGDFPPRDFDIKSILHEVTESVISLVRYDQMLETVHNKELFLAPLRNREAVLSSRIEGTVSTVDDILELELRLKENSSGSSSTMRSQDQDVLETLLYKKALKKAQEMILEGYPLSDNLLCQIHRGLLSEGRGSEKKPGMYKTMQNYLVHDREVRFIPIAPEHLQSGMDRLFTYLKESTHLPLIKAALMHLEFEALHPFNDGNGRIGRMLVPLYLWSQKLISGPYFYISDFLEANKEEYLTTMRRVSEDGSWEEWCLFFFRAVRDQAKQNMEKLGLIGELYEEMKEELMEMIASKYSVQFLDYIFTHPLFSVSSLSEEAGIPKGSAVKFPQRLLEKGLVEIVREAAGNRGMIYRFEPLMKIVRV